MGLFDIIGGMFKSEKTKLEEALLGNPPPLPDVFVRLINIYRQEGDDQNAMRVAKRGASIYPDAMSIVNEQQALEQVERGNQKRRLQAKIEAYPNPILFSRLAELHKADGKIDQAIFWCENGIKRYADYGGTHLILGQIEYDRGNYQSACTYLERSVELDRYNYQGLKALAECYMQLGRQQDAVARLKDILNSVPGDEATIQLLKQARDALGHTGAAPEEASFPPPQAAQSPAPMRTGGHREQVLNDCMSQFIGVGGVKGAIVVDFEGLVIASHLASDMDEQLIGGLVTNIYRTTVNGTKQLHIGEFGDGLIEGDEANVHIIVVDDMLLAVLAEPTVKLGLLQKAIRDFVTAAVEIG